MLPGLGQGTITEISGARSSGCTTLLNASLSAATSNGELSVLIDGSDAFDLASAEAAGIQFNRLLWVQCHHYWQDAFLATDLIVHSNIFRLVVLDLRDFAPRDLHEIPISRWHRLRLAIADTPGAIIVASPEPLLWHAAAVQLELAGHRAEWSTLLASAELSVSLRKPVHSAGRIAALCARAV